MEAIDSSTINAVRALVLAAQQPQALEPDPTAGKKHLYVVPENFDVREINANALRPFRAIGTVQATDIESYKNLILRFGNTLATIIYVNADVTGGKFVLTSTAVFNDNETGNAANFGDHRAAFRAVPTAAWLAWEEMVGRWNTQEEMAIFLENRQLDIFTPEGETVPTGTQILELARNLEINKTAKFRSAIRTTSGVTELELVETESEASQQRIKLFDRFLIAVRPFYGASPWQFEARMRFKTNSESKSVVFRVDLVRKDVVLEQAVSKFIEELKTTGFPVICGTPALPQTL